MKKKSSSESAPARSSLGEGGFFKLRVLVAVLLRFSAITLVFFAFGKASAQPRPSAQNPTDTHGDSYSYAGGYSRAQSYTQAAADPAPKTVARGTLLL
jgi:hypothetical protein